MLSKEGGRLLGQVRLSAHDVVKLYLGVAEHVAQLFYELGMEAYCPVPDGHDGLGLGVGREDEVIFDKRTPPRKIVGILERLLSMLGRVAAVQQEFVIVEPAGQRGEQDDVPVEGVDPGVLWHVLEEKSGFGPALKIMLRYLGSRRGVPMLVVGLPGLAKDELRVLAGPCL